MNMNLTDIKGIGRVYEEKLKEAGIGNVEEFAIADIKEVAEKTGIKEERLKKWQKEAKKMVKYKKAEVVDDIPKISSITIDGDRAVVKIRDIVHENVPVFKGNFDELKEKMEKEEMAVYFKGKAKLWFGGKWHDGVPVKTKKVEKEKKGFFEKLKEWWKR